MVECRMENSSFFFIYCYCFQAEKGRIHLENEHSGEGLRLLQKGKKGLMRFLFSRMGVMLVLLVLQAGMLFTLFRWFADFLPHVLGGSLVFTLGMAVYLINSRIDPSAKITWLAVILLVPVFGALFFWYTQSELGHRALKKRVADLQEETRDCVPQRPETLERLERESPGDASLAAYLRREGSFPVFENTRVTWFPLGEAKFAAMLEQLEKAERFVFLEYFIVEEGTMWGRILEILARKAAQGVEVRVMYDGTCEFSTLPHNYPEKLKQLGISCRPFAPMSPFLSTHYNYRDHRKILVIDGRVGFTGGVNLADEYINATVKFGHWKDTAILLEGEAVRSLTLLFLQMWNITEREPEFDAYLNVPVPEPVSPEAGYVIPYGDCPLDGERVGERVYMDILNRAVRYVHIMSPYLILDGEMETALRFAAERGVDVRLMLPGIPDRKAPYALAKTHYRALLASGVKIYEYTPGFVHAKVFVSDDCRAVVGTINLDYRSLYHHFECASYLYRTACIPEIEQDFQETLTKCRTVTEETIRQEKLSMKIEGAAMKIIAPLL